jgi:hypothetical protein
LIIIENSSFSEEATVGNTTANHANQSPQPYSKTREGILFSAIAVGILIGIYPSTAMLARFGTR